MKIRLDGCGYLWIDGKDKTCPFAHNKDNDNVSCGEWCALFEISISDDGRIEVSLCKRVYDCAPEDFTDERKPE